MNVVIDELWETWSGESSRYVQEKSAQLLGSLLGDRELNRFLVEGCVRVLVKPYGLMRTLEIGPAGSFSCSGKYIRRSYPQTPPWIHHCINVKPPKWFVTYPPADRVLTVALYALAEPERFFKVARPAIGWAWFKRDDDRRKGSLQRLKDRFSD